MKRMETLRIIIAAAAVIVAVLIGLGTWFLSGCGGERTVRYGAGSVAADRNEKLPVRSGGQGISGRTHP